MDFGPLDMLQLMHTVYAVPPAPVEPIAPVPFVPGDFSDMWCRNPTGDKVEWSIIYKAPAAAMSRGTSETVSSGVQYGYIDSATKLDATVRMQLFDDITSSQSNPLYNTLDVLFKYPREFLVEKNLTYLLYNDQPPAELSTSTTNGIAKGVLLFGNNSGVWMSHTLANFGQFFQEKYLFPEEARREAQTIFCMSLSSDNWPKIVAHLRRESPNVYDWNILPAMFEAHPGLKRLVEKNFNHDDPGAESNILIGVNGIDFLAFSKNAVHNYDIYETLVAPQLESNIYVRGSQEGDQHLQNYCSDFNITEIDDIELKMGQDVTFKNIRRSQDNSRWAVSERDYWVCFGSVERRKSHLPRGAEVFCLQNQPANILLANSIDRFSKCKNLPDEVAAKIAAVPAGTSVAVGSAGDTYVRPVIVRPSFGIPRVYYGGLPSFGLGFPFKKILKNPIVVGAAVAGVMHYRHKQQIKKLNRQYALASGYEGYGARSYPSPPFRGSSGHYSSGLTRLLGGDKSHAPPPYPGSTYPTTSGGSYPTVGSGYPTNYGYPPPAYSPWRPGFNPGYPTSYGYANPGSPAQPGSYSAASQGYRSPGYPTGSHGYINPGQSYAGQPFSPGGYRTQPTTPTAPMSSYPVQPASNPSFNSAHSTAPAPSAPSTQKGSNQRSSSISDSRSPPVRAPRTNTRPVRVEKTVTRTVTSYGPARTNFGRNNSSRSRSSSSSKTRGGRIRKG
ncbi:deoxyribonuclease-2-alpha-like [Tropilaelaps mercedesae]|uniref:Deoxyribonuclease-2-alpha-like n=1 Tax=Tropilaelaps mercedesae TaxID=418985 RepID=A0A1V9X6I5_9ACAR|nr:deoxyribonuclease-2-alpha-like [Tropilaelaps mercedesae]